MMTIEELKGKKMYGFKFAGSSWNSKMSKCIKEVGIIEDPYTTDSNMIGVRFEKISEHWYYPLHLIEENLVDDLPEIDLKELLTQIKSL